MTCCESVLHDGERIYSVVEILFNPGVQCISFSRTGFFALNDLYSLGAISCMEFATASTHEWEKEHGWVGSIVSQWERKLRNVV